MELFNAEEAAQRSLDSAKPRVTAVLAFLRKCVPRHSLFLCRARLTVSVRREVLAAAADGQFRAEVSVSDALFYDAVFQHLIVEALRQDGVRASFAHGTFALDWSA
jgi:hypothetical protein